LPYDPVRDLVPIAAAIDNFFAIAVSTPTGVHSLHSFIEVADSSREIQLGGHRRPAQFIFLALQKRTGLALTQVPYRDFAPALQDFSENRIQVVVTAPTILMPPSRVARRGY